MVHCTMSPVRVFISYSHVDEDFRSSLAAHLSVFERKELIQIWHDRCLTAGSDWKTDIGRSIEEADLALLLVSADFLASDYCYEEEMERALERHRAGEAIVIPIVVRSSAWKQTPLGELHALPRNARPIAEWEHPDQAWLNVVEGIAEAAKTIVERQRLAATAGVDRRSERLKTQATHADDRGQQSPAALDRMLEQIEHMAETARRGLRGSDGDSD